jgi:hypothetical protein
LIIKIVPPILYLVKVSHYIALNPKALSPITQTPHKFGEQVLALIKAGRPIPIVPKVAASSFLLGY